MHAVTAIYTRIDTDKKRPAAAAGEGDTAAQPPAEARTRKPKKTKQVQDPAEQGQSADAPAAESADRSSATALTEDAEVGGAGEALVKQSLKKWYKLVTNQEQLAELVAEIEEHDEAVQLAAAWARHLAPRLAAAMHAEGQEITSTYMSFKVRLLS